MTTVDAKTVVVLRGATYTISDVDIGAADRSVGIMSDYVEGYKLTDEAGNEVSEDFYNSLTDQEQGDVDQAIWDKISAEEDAYDYDDEHDAVCNDMRLGSDDMGRY